MARDESCEIAVVGGGPTGLCAALLLARGGRDVALVAPEAADDGRSVALLRSSLDQLALLGVDQAIADAGAPLSVMRLVDDTGSLLRAPEIAFHASELDLPAFGYSIMTTELTRILESALAAADRVRRIRAGATGLQPGAGTVSVATSAGVDLAARLVVGADGRGSLCRDAAGLTMRSWSYPQRALVTTFRHTEPHDNTSTEFHTRAGPFTVVPIGPQRCGLVWVDRPEVIERWKDAPRSELARELQRRSHFILGGIEVEADCITTPMSGGYLPAPAARRIALVGEAAHYFPPIGAQGLNLGIRDCAGLARAVARHGTDPGEDAVLQHYIRSRRLDIAARTFGVDLLNRSLLVDFLPLQAARAAAIGLAGMFAPVRGLLMRLGMAAPLV